MKQLVDKSAVIAEIERLQKPTMDINHNFTSDYNQGLYDGLSQLELFIDSLPKEKKPIREYVSSEDSTLGKLYKEAMEELEEKIALYEKNHKKSVSNGLEQAANDYVGHAPEIDEDLSVYSNREAFKAGAQWQKENLWKNAQGDDLPEIDREVIVLYQPYPCEGNEYAVSFAHRPPERWYGRNLDGEEHVFEPKTYDKGEWNIPNVVWWLDLDLPIKR